MQAHSLTFFVASFPFSPSINSITVFFNPSLLTNPLTDPSLVLTLTPTLISSTTSLAAICCSHANGHAKIGTPAQTLSNTEFQPHWLTNPLTLFLFGSPTPSPPFLYFFSLFLQTL
ncbi:hypothetical protein PIB30_037791 [Stylosanthes scabra]|uniref:Uncharacterized protein n=1 Tax=Stylosanthes scabra TaxID=79078 RepID=A0ABU6XCZ9_9FABA|nr:hypothetical protein [Stylosanthes scabra]